MRIPESHRKPYRLGVCLSGGGARGFAHIGAMRALYELGLRPDIVAGVSAGSVVAAFHGANMLEDSNVLLNLFAGSRFRDFAEIQVPTQAFFSLDRFKDKLEAIIPYKTIESLPNPTVICATDLDNATKMAFTSGPLAERVVASCSIPIIFEPVTIDGRRYVDGGVLRNLPAWAIRHLCDTLIGINCSPFDPTASPAKGIIDIARRSFSVMSKNNVTPDLELCDLVVSLTETASHQTFDLSSLEMLVESGYLTTLRALKSLALR